jgi:hypothetical protein
MKTVGGRYGVFTPWQILPGTSRAELFRYIAEEEGRFLKRGWSPTAGPAKIPKELCGH